VVQQQRDLEVIHAGLSHWLAAKLSRATDVRLSPLTKPGLGFSNETLLGDVAWREGGERRAERLVFRLEPRDFLVFPEYDLPKQVRVMQCLRSTGLAVPEVLWLEEDGDVLGCPFYVMRRIEGEVPPDIPFYHAAGVLAGAPPDRRAAMWWRGIETLARIHEADWRALGLSFLGAPTDGEGAIDPQLDYYERFLRWAQGSEPEPVLEAALRWLREHRPAPQRISLCWGDARLPNIMYRDGEVAGVFDWEMAFLGDPEADLAWWLFLDWHHSEGNATPRLEGLPPTEETVRRYEELTGRAVRNLRYYEVFAGFRFGVIMVSIYRNMRARGVAPTSSGGRGLESPITRRLAELLDLPAATVR
jgi:aminoglycoside phosphotransferase (APT) family kinase protein